MSISSISTAIDRIKVAREESMIAIFKVYGDERLINAVFDSTIMTRSLYGSRDYIGSYHKNMSMDAVNKEIHQRMYE